jgi:hypothetical protein
MSVMTVPEVTERLGLHQMRGREWFIQGCCALTGDGLYEGLDWLTKVMSKRALKISHLVQHLEANLK